MKSLPLTAETLAHRLAALGFPVSGEIAQNILAYLSLLVKWNKSMNLTGTRSWEETLETLVIDSFYLAAFLPLAGLPASPSTLDLGAGAGLPGIPLRFLWKEGIYTLIEVREKRAMFMKTVLASCDAGNTRVFHGKAEDFFAASPPADCIISRAFMPWQELLGFVREALSPEGRIVFLALAPTPAPLPPGWAGTAETSYTVRGKTRYLWSLGREAS